jgi:hypothetical protein
MQSLSENKYIFVKYFTEKCSYSYIYIYIRKSNQAHDKQKVLGRINRLLFFDAKLTT